MCKQGLLVFQGVYEFLLPEACRPGAVTVGFRSCFESGKFNYNGFTGFPF